MPVKCQILVTEHAVARLDSCAGAGSFAGEPSRRGPARPMTGCPRVTSHCQHPDLFGGRPGVGTTGAWGVPDTRCQIPSIYQQTATVTAPSSRTIDSSTWGDDGFGLEVVVVLHSALLMAMNGGRPLWSHHLGQSTKGLKSRACARKI
ncbi:hypothetical protein B0T13DRAFT_463452 [Neurospora crassa]|nr:hypothetical protein B0T13DRAFT_463452 [Neurospora crassa]